MNKKLNKKSATISVATGIASILFLALVGTHAISGLGNPAERAQTATVKKASEQFKNIQVLKDLPADQLYPTMHFMADSLGVQCVDCHVGVPGQVDGEKDDKQMQRTARKMILMTIEINRANFDGQNGNRTVTCYTCHRGSRQPMAAPASSNGSAPKSPLRENYPWDFRFYIYRSFLDENFTGANVLQAYARVWRIFA
jgi:Photosynthetic reaction centre cytochrome C subunit